MTKRRGVTGPLEGETVRGTSKKQQRYHAAMVRHREVGHPEGYEGPCWGPTPDDFDYVDAAARGEAWPSTTTSPSAETAGTSAETTTEVS